MAPPSSSFLRRRITALRHAIAGARCRQLPGQVASPADTVREAIAAATWRQLRQLTGHIGAMRGTLPAATWRQLHQLPAPVAPSSHAIGARSASRRSALPCRLAPLLLLTAAPACAQSTPAPAVQDADPALWVVRSPKATVYLFGTIHVLKPGLTWFDEAVRQAFDRSDQVVLELVMPDAVKMQAIVAANAAQPQGPTLTDRLPPARRRQYADALSGLGLPATAFDRMKPWFAATNLSILPLMKIGYDPANGPESIITAEAKAQGKPVVGLETAEQQIGYFGQLSDKAQIDFLDSTLDELPKVGPTMATMVDEWAKGQPDALARDMNNSLKDSPEVARVLLVDRNRRWADWIRNRLATPGTVFVAVGAGHLAGPQSVQRQLARLGIRAERVRY